MKFVILALLIVVVIAFFVVIWKAAKHWRWYNIVAACITMLLGGHVPVSDRRHSEKSCRLASDQRDAREVRRRREAEQRRIKFGDPSDSIDRRGRDLAFTKTGESWY